MGAFIEQVQCQTREIRNINTARQQKELEKEHKEKLLSTLEVKIETIFSTKHDIKEALSIVYDINQRDDIIYSISHKEKDLKLLNNNYDKIAKKIQTRYTNYNKYHIQQEEQQQQEQINKDNEEQQKKEERKRSWIAFFMLLGLIIKYTFLIAIGIIYFIFKVIEGMSK